MAFNLGDLESLYPFAHHYLDVGGPRMHYVDEGPRSDHALVMLHGNPTWSFYWRELIKAFRDEHRVIAPDHIGCGLSEKPQDHRYTLGTHIANLTRLLDELEIRHATLVLHDWGGAIGSGWAVQHVDRVARMVVLNTAAFRSRPTPWRIAVCGWPVLGDWLVRGLNGFLLASFVMATTKRKRFTREIKEAYLFPYDNWDNRVAIQQFVRDIPSSPKVASYPVLLEIEEGLAALTNKPMLIGWGMKDWCFDRRPLAGWIERFPAAEVHRFADAGHYVVEDAHERIIPLVRAFLEKGVPGSEKA